MTPGLFSLLLLSFFSLPALCRINLSRGLTGCCPFPGNADNLSRAYLCKNRLPEKGNKVRHCPDHPLAAGLSACRIRLVIFLTKSRKGNKATLTVKVNGNVSL